MTVAVRFGPLEDGTTFYLCSCGLEALADGCMTACLWPINAGEPERRHMSQAAMREGAGPSPAHAPDAWALTPCSMFRQGRDPLPGPALDYSIPHSLRVTTHDFCSAKLPIVAVANALLSSPSHHGVCPRPTANLGHEPLFAARPFRGTAAMT